MRGASSTALVLALCAGCQGQIGETTPVPDRSVVGFQPALPTRPNQPAPPTEPSEPVEPTEPPPPFEPGPGVVRRLLAAEYRASIESLLGAEAAAAAEAPPDAALNGLDAIGAAQLSIDDTAVRTYERSALAVAAVAVASGEARRRYTTCEPLSLDAPDCHRELIERLGRRAFRRPLTAEEIQRWLTVAQTAATTLEVFDGGVLWVVSGLLQSPSFLYRVEVGVPETSEPSQAWLTPWELATRMAYFLTGTGPDDLLLDAALGGALDTDTGRRQQAARLLSSAKARTALATFYDEVLRLRELGNVVKNPDLFGAFDQRLAASMRTETLMLIEDIVWTRDADFREILDADYTFVNSSLASLYGLQARLTRGFARVELPADGRRGGLLGQASFLTMMSHAVTTSPTLRGKFVREVLMCQAIPAPPPNVNTDIPSDQPGEPPKTMREKLIQHQTDPACAGCHVLMDDIGLGLENFDAIGAYRATENGLPVDAAGALDGAVFEGAAALGTRLRERERTMGCVVRNLYRQAVGHVEDNGETVAIDAITAKFAAADYRLKAALIEVVASEAFRMVEAPR